MTAFGVDVSKYQGAVDWAKAKARLGDGAFAFIRALDDDGLTADPYFAANWRGARQDGVRRGVYFPYYQGLAPLRQLYSLLRVVQTDWGELPPAIDVESGIESGVWTLEQNMALQWTAWLLERAAGRAPLIYTNPNYWDTCVAPSYSGNPTPASRDNTWALHYGLWLACWNYDPSRRPAYPSTWKGTPFVCWQYSNQGDGHAHGCSSEHVDLDTDQLVSPAPGVPPAPAPQPTPVTPPAPTPPPLPAQPSAGLGVNVIYSGDDARAAIAHGCPFVSVTFNAQLAWELKQAHPDLLVGARGNFWGGHLPSETEFLNFVGAAIRPGVVVYGVNEGDHIGQQTPDEIRRRAEFDAKWFAYCRQRGATYAGGGFSMGEPNIVRPEIRAALRQYYAPLVNSGMWFNQHTYSGDDHSGIPVKERIYRTQPYTISFDGVSVTARQTWWLEERWRFYCAFCGFNPTKFKFISDETGVDDNPGSFRDNGFSDAEVIAWCRQFVKLTGDPVWYDGKLYPSNYLGGALFQAGDDARWAGYEVRGYFDLLQQAGWGRA